MDPEWAQTFALSHPMESQLNWMNTEDLKNPHFVQVCCFFVFFFFKLLQVVKLPKENPQLSRPSEGTFLFPHKVTESICRMGHDYPFNPFCYCRAVKKCDQRFPLHVLLGKGEEEQNKTIPLEGSYNDWVWLLTALGLPQLKELY